MPNNISFESEVSNEPVTFSEIFYGIRQIILEVTDPVLSTY